MRSEVIPCVYIRASDWLLEDDVQKWITQRDVAHWPESDVFTVYDNGEGPDMPFEMYNENIGMPQWLWDEIGKIVESHNLEYCVVRLLDEEA